MRDITIEYESQIPYIHLSLQIKDTLELTILYLV